MARPAAMALLLAACLLLIFQVANCSRPSPEETETTASVVVPRPALTGYDEQHNKLGAETTGTGGAAAEKTRADDGAATLSSATGSFVLRGKDGNDDSMLLRSKLARRFLAASGGVVEGADSAAGPSCHSNDTHNKSCPPAANKG